MRPSALNFSFQKENRTLTKLTTIKAAVLAAVGFVLVLGNWFCLPAFLTNSEASPSKPCDFLIERLQKRYESTKDISGDFIQKTTVPGDPEPVMASGKVYFKRPYLMRWDYEKPDRQLLVTSGEKVYLYEIDAKQVSVLSRKQFLSTKISRAFFLGKGDIRRDFVVVGCTLGPDGWVLRLRPKEPIPQLKSLELTIDKDNYLVKKTVIEDQMGGTTSIIFNKTKVNTGLDPDLFKFKIPKGVRVFHAG